MKKKSALSFLLLALSLVLSCTFFSCSDDSNDNGGGNKENNDFPKLQIKWGASQKTIKSLIQDFVVNESKTKQLNENDFELHYDPKGCMVDMEYNFYRDKLNAIYLILDPQKITEQKIRETLQAEGFELITEEEEAKTRTKLNVDDDDDVDDDVDDDDDYDEFDEKYLSKDGKTMINFYCEKDGRLLYFLTYKSADFEDSELFYEPSIKWGADPEYIKSYEYEEKLDENTSRLKYTKTAYNGKAFTNYYYLKNGKLHDDLLIFNIKYFKAEDLQAMLECRYNKVENPAPQVVDPTVTEPNLFYITEDGNTYVNLYGYSKDGSSSLRIKYFSKDDVPTPDPDALKKAIAKYDFAYPPVEDMIPVCKDEKWGFIDMYGNEVIPCKYAYFDDFHEGLCTVQDDETSKWGFLDKTGKTIIPIKNKGYNYCSEGIALAEESSKNWVLYDQQGNKLFTINATYVYPFSEGYARIQRTDYRFDFIDHTGKSVHEGDASFKGYADVYDFSCGLAVYLDEKTNLRGYMNKKFELEIPCIYQNAQDFSEDYANVRDQDASLYKIIDKKQNTIADNIGWGTYFCEGFMSILKSGKWSYIDCTGKNPFAGKFLNGEFEDQTGDFCDGMAWVTDGSLWGYINSKGDNAIPCKYDEVYDFSEGYATVGVDGRYGLIDKQGNEMWCRQPVTSPSPSFKQKLMEKKRKQMTLRQTR